MTNIYKAMHLPCEMCHLTTFATKEWLRLFSRNTNLQRERKGIAQRDATNRPFTGFAYADDRLYVTLLVPFRWRRWRLWWREWAWKGKSQQEWDREGDREGDIKRGRE